MNDNNALGNANDGWNEREVVEEPTPTGAAEELQTADEAQPRFKHTSSNGELLELLIKRRNTLQRTLDNHGEIRDSSGALMTVGAAMHQIEMMNQQIGIRRALKAADKGFGDDTDLDPFRS